MTENENTEILQDLKRLLVRWEKDRRENAKERLWAGRITLGVWVVSGFCLSYITHHSIWWALLNALGAPFYILYWILFEAGLFEMLQHFKEFHP